MSEGTHHRTSGERWKGGSGGQELRSGGISELGFGLQEQKPAWRKGVMGGKRWEVMY